MPPLPLPLPPPPLRTSISLSTAAEDPFVTVVCSNGHMLVSNGSYRLFREAICRQWLFEGGHRVHITPRDDRGVTCVGVVSCEGLRLQWPHRIRPSPCPYAVRPSPCPCTQRFRCCCCCGYRCDGWSGTCPLCSGGGLLLLLLLS